LVAAFKLSPGLWVFAAVACGAGTLLLAIVGGLVGVFLPAGASLLLALTLFLSGLTALLRRPSGPQEKLWSLEEAEGEYQRLLEAGDPRGLRLLHASLSEELRSHPKLQICYALSLVQEGREGLLEKALKGHEQWSVLPEQREQLAQELEEEGYLELALEQWEWLYRRQASRSGVSETLFRLRSERDERWGVLSPRAVRDLLGWSFRGLTPMGEGGEALLFRGQERESGRHVVLKVLHPRLLQQEDTLRRFCSEVAALEEVAAPQIPKLLRVERGRLPYLALEYRPGSAPGASESGEAPRWFLELIRTLGAIHKAGWVHRDLHPGNLLVDQVQGLTLLDFGLATRRGEVGSPGGTVGFASPEQILGCPADPKQDIYSLGVLMRDLNMRRTAEGTCLEELWRSCLQEEPRVRPGLEDLGRALAGQTTSE
jgi:tRNA A-37 threonylcarbamoyl transferase component Bud32